MDALAYKVLSSGEVPNKEIVLSGVESLDKAIVGLPVPGFVEIFGLPGSGKSLLSLLWKPGLYIDVEGSLQGEWLKAWSPTTRVVRANSWDVVKEVLEDHIDITKIIVVDSLASIDLEEEERPGDLARIVGRWVVKTTPTLKDTCLVFLNHIRAEFAPFPLISSPGGWGIKHSATLRLKTKEEKTKVLEIHETIVEVVKSKIGPSGTRCSVFFNLEKHTVYSDRALALASRRT